MAQIVNTIRWDDNTQELKRNLREGVGALEDMKGAIGPVGDELSAMKSHVSGLVQELAGLITVGAIVQFGRQVLAAGDQIQKMSDQTGLAFDEVQKLQYIAGQSGTSIEGLVGAVQNLQQRLGDDNSGAAGAMAKLRINADEFNKLDTYQQLLTLAEGVRGIQDPTEQASVAAAIFGKTWKEILPAIKSGMEDVGNQAPIMADATVTALDRIGDTMTAAQQHALSWGGSIVLAIEGVGFAFGDFLSKFNPEHLGVTTTELLRMQGALNDPNGLQKALQAIPPVAKVVIDDVKALGLSAKDAASLERGLTASVEESIAANKASATSREKVAKADKAWKKILSELDSAGGDWQQTLEGIDGEVVEAIKYYLKAGVSQGTLSDAYGLTAVQVKAVSSQLQAHEKQLSETQKAEKDYADAVQKGYDDLIKEKARLDKQAQDHTKRSLEDTDKLWDEYYASIDKQTLSTTDYQIKQVKRWFDDEVAKLKDDDAAWALHYDALVAVADRKMKEITNLNDPFYRAQQKLKTDLKRDWDQLMDDIAGGFTKTFSEDIVDVLFGDGGFKDVWHNLWTMLKDDVKAILADLLNNVIQGFIAGMAQKLGGFFAGLAAGGKGGAGFWGMLAGLLAGGVGGGSTTPIQGGYFDQDGNWVSVPGNPFPDLTIPKPEDPRHESHGGIVYADRGRLINWTPKGTDTIPAMLTPGEAVLNKDAASHVGADAINALNAGARYLAGGGIVHESPYGELTSDWQHGLRQILYWMPWDLLVGHTTSRAENRAFEQGWMGAESAGFAGEITDFLAHQATLYSYAGDERLRTWLSGYTVSYFESLKRRADGPINDVINGLSRDRYAAFSDSYTDALWDGWQTSPGDYYREMYAPALSPGQPSDEGPIAFAAGGMASGTDIVPAMLTPGELVLNASQQSNLADNMQSSGGKIDIFVIKVDGNDPEEVANVVFARIKYNDHGARSLLVEALS